MAAEPKPTACSDFAREGKDSYATLRRALLAHGSGCRRSYRASAVRTRIHYAALKRENICSRARSGTLFVTQEDEGTQRRERHRAQRLASVRAMTLFQSLTEEER
ncbi:MAG: hypothetical protein U0235_24960 [Polyangiaceae bacterium]